MAIHEGNTKDMNIDNIKFKILAYGPPGSGKTFFGATMPKPYFIVLDRGLKGLAVRGEAVPYVEVDTYEDVMQVLAEIGSGRRAADCESIVLDHLTELTPLVIDSTLRGARKEDMNMGLWGVAKDKLRVLIHQLTNLSDDSSMAKRFHTLMISHESVEKNELRGGVWGIPNTIGQFAYQVGGWFDLFLYFHQEVTWNNGKQIPSWKMNAVKYVDFEAKDRLGILEPTEENNFQVIIDRFKEKAHASN